MKRNPPCYCYKRYKINVVMLFILPGLGCKALQCQQYLVAHIEYRLVIDA